MKKILVILFFIVLFFPACHERRSRDPIVSQDISKDDFEEIMEEEQAIVEIFTGFVAEEIVCDVDHLTVRNRPSILEGERYSNHQGIVFDTTINAMNVNVHSHPSLQSEVLFQVSENTEITIFGTSKEADTINDFTGHWLYISIMRGQPNQFRSGWIFSKFVNNGNIVPNELRITGFGPDQGWGTRLIGTYMQGETEVHFSVRAMRGPNQPFWTFVWNHNSNVDWDSVTHSYIHEKYFRFDTVPGTYIWYPETGELRHISYIGGWPESWEKGPPVTRLSDDLQFILQSRWSGPGVFGLRAWRVDCETMIYSGMFFGDSIRLNGHNVEVAYLYPANEWNPLSNEIIAFAEDFIRNNPVRPTQTVMAVIVEFNLDTGARRIIEGRWQFMQ